MILCPQCGAQHLPNTLFCDQCGQALFNSVEEVAGQTSAQRSPPASFRLRFEIHHTGRIETLPLTDGILIGRMDTDTAPRPDLDLGDVGELALSVSRRHARIRLTRDPGKDRGLGQHERNVFSRPTTPPTPICDAARRRALPSAGGCRTHDGSVDARILARRCYSENENQRRATEHGPRDTRRAFSRLFEQQLARNFNGGVRWPIALLSIC